MKKMLLNGAWRGVCLMPEGERIDLAAQVPGSSIADLIRAGRLPEDIFWRDNAAMIEAYERCEYDYEKEFDYSPAEGETCVLKFARLDTYCGVYLNGLLLGECMDEHIPHEFDVTDVLREGTNVLRVHFDSPVARTDGLQARSGAFTTERLYTRRTQCTYGWDWVLRMIGCGVAGPVELRSVGKDEMTLLSAYAYTKCVDEDSAAIGVDLEFGNRIPKRIVTVRICAPDGSLCREVRRYVAEPLVRISLDIPEPELWYPVGYGAQPLYTLQVLDGESVVHEETFGVRFVRIMQLPDRPGSENYEKCLSIKNPHYDENREFSGFILKVNGVRILCRGANWVPCEPFCAGSTDEKITRTLELAASGGVNMLRIWGGGAFETAHFYDECSRLGIMVTQDFLMACGHYPEEEDWFIDCLKREAEFAARHIRNKACLMWWSGDNENAVEGSDLHENYPGRRSALEGIGPVLMRLDPYREFLPSSPYGGSRYASNTVGTTHNTQFLGSDILPYMMGGRCDDYKDAWKRFRARFIAEEPQLGAISEGSMLKFMTEEDIYGPDDAMWRFHTRTNPGLATEVLDISLSFAESLLGRFASTRDRYFKLRYLQYEWIRFTLEQMRREMWFCSGMIYWMLNDCWPAASGWAFIDYYNRPKDAYYAFKRCAGRLVLSLDYEDGRYRLYACNAGGEIRGMKARVCAVKGGSVRELYGISADVPAETVARILEFEAAPGEGGILVAQAEWEGGRDRTFYRHGALPLVPAQAEIIRCPGERAVIVRAEEYVHAVEMQGDAVFEDSCFSLLPGEARKIRYTPVTEGEISLTAYTIG